MEFITMRPMPPLHVREGIFRFLPRRVFFRSCWVPTNSQSVFSTRTPEPSSGRIKVCLHVTIVARCSRASQSRSRAPMSTEKKQSQDLNVITHEYFLEVGISDA